MYYESELAIDEFYRILINILPPMEISESLKRDLMDHIEAFEDEVYRAGYASGQMD